ncbi:MAG TPA: GspH/FimT family protein [Thermoanaerobaculia bacterium]|nr:GspH/FimT family protein [Thermoanaerobaculia bacterium]
MISATPRVSNRGFTIIELIVVVAIVGIVLAIALPYFGVISRRAHLDAAARAVQMDLLKARVAALRRGSDVGVEVSTDVSKDSYHSAIVYIDANANGVLDSGETILARSPLPPSDANLVYRIAALNSVAPGTSAQTFSFVFSPLGNATTGSSSKALFLSDGKGNLIQVGVPIATSGKVAMTKLSGASYVPPPWIWY